MLDVIDLSFDYQDQPVLAHISFQLPAQCIMHLKGANGAGKTTLLKLLCGLHKPQQGEIRLHGENIENDLPTYQQQLCFVGHKPGINPQLTLKENCLFDLHYGRLDKNFIELASIFNLDNHLEQPCGCLSAGQRRQVSLLRLWMTDAKIWLLDEPLVALDESAQVILINHLKQHVAKGGSVLLTSHQNLPLQADDYQEFCL
ncbi:MAG: heme ABC exporter ATP-binding protein CcmA [Legionella sp.]|nr:MAG: heme ABC exporter ATP-binding protein CcmA [Legionella sp.]